MTGAIVAGAAAPAPHVLLMPFSTKATTGGWDLWSAMFPPRPVDDLGTK
jgi:hypothetical protein